MLGLSPLARGNHAQRLGGRHVEGPIPARAGQPRSGCRRANPLRAYPRSRGATPTARLQYVRTEGLSPLARGNLPGTWGAKFQLGPIPARAGQPRGYCSCATAARAYPRSRGATVDPSDIVADGEGLSPLARGNRGHSQSASRLARAYPRSRGATGVSGAFMPSIKGLSPLARGNLAKVVFHLDTQGPIPARAGQPRTVIGHLVSGGAYPRSRGATL